MIQDLMENVKLTPQEQNIVSYIEQHPKEVMKLNAKELSEKIFVSPPTMNRFIKKLGFNGYFDFQRTFIQEQSMVEETKYRRITKDSYINDIIDTLPLIYQHVFKETQKLTKTDAFMKTQGSRRNFSFCTLQKCHIPPAKCHTNQWRSDGISDTIKTTTQKGAIANGNATSRMFEENLYHSLWRESGAGTFGRFVFRRNGRICGNHGGIGFGEDHAAEYTRSPRPANQRKGFSGWKRFDDGQGTGNCSVPAG